MAVSSGMAMSSGMANPSGMAKASPTAGSGGSTVSAGSSGSVTVGSITVTGAEVKVPVTPEETVGYLRITDAGTADVLLGASSPDA